MNGLVSPKQTKPVPAIMAVVDGFTVTVVVPVALFEQLLASATLTRFHANVPATPVGAETVTLFPTVVTTV